MKTYKFEDNSWWDNPPCDCCQGGLVECWTCYDNDQSIVADSQLDALMSVVYIETGEYLWTLDEYPEESELLGKLSGLGIYVEFGEFNPNW